MQQVFHGVALEEQRPGVPEGARASANLGTHRHRHIKSEVKRAALKDCLCSNALPGVAMEEAPGALCSALQMHHQHKH